jgi:hypothetical protein
LQTPNAESPVVGAVTYGDFTHEWFFTPASLADLLRLSGFEQYEARPSGPYVHGLTRWLKLWHGESLPRHWYLQFNRDGKSR